MALELIEWIGLNVIQRNCNLMENQLWQLTIEPLELSDATENDRLNSSMSDSYDQIEDYLYYKYRNRLHLAHVFVHKTYLQSKSKNDTMLDKMAHVGDAVLEYVLSKYLFNRKEMFTSGEIHGIRSYILCNSSLGSLLLHHNLHQFIRTSLQFRETNTKFLIQFDKIKQKNAMPVIDVSMISQ